MVSSGLALLSSLSGMNASAPVQPMASTGTESASGGFLTMVDSALRDVSAAQDAAATAESGYTAGVSGAMLGKALVASDRAQVAWTATVAVRNEVVSAYQSIMNMPF